MKIPTARQFKELDAATIKTEEITSLNLMERASTQVTHFICNQYTDKNRPVVVFAGPAGNGGDGLAVARQLVVRGYANVQVFLFNTGHTLSEDCKANAERLQSECPNATFTEVTQQFEAPQFDQRPVIVDALFGTGLNKPLSGGFAALVQFINACTPDIVAIDVPSGLMCEDNTLNSHSAIVKARHTVTFQLPKLAMLLADNQEYVGQLHIVNIGLTADGIARLETPYHIMEREEVKALLHPRSAFGHKGTFGHAMIIAGKYGMAGAAVLAAKACLKGGAGKVTVHTPRRNNDILQTAVPEAILHHDEDELIFTTPIRHASYEALCIGPGIGTDKRTALALIEQTSHAGTPLLLDADAINIFGHHKGWIAQIPKNTILTPHPGELQQLGICNADSYSILLEAINLATRHQFIVVLKGHYTAICSPDGHVHFNPTGNSGMGTAGCGDVLSGLITALLAQGYAPFDASRLGVYLHGLAGDIAAAQLGEHSLTASDVLAALPEAFKQIQAE